MSKKIVSLVIGVLGFITIEVTVFSILTNKNEDNTNTNNSNSNNTKNEEPSNSDNQTRIKLTFEDRELYVRLIDNESSRDLINMLPLEAYFEDYNNTEKIATLPRKLELNNNPGEYSVQVGDFAYYAPWGNLSIFYKEFKSSSSLQKLGEFETGIEELKNVKGKAVLEIADELEE